MLRASCILEQEQGNRTAPLSRRPQSHNDSGEFDWIIRLHWDNWWKSGHVQVAGIDMDLRLKEYIRSYIPAIVEERTYPDTRVNLHKELRKLGLSSNDRYEFICRTKGLCGCNDITMDRLYEGVLTAPIINGDEKAADEVYQDICSLAWAGDKVPEQRTESPGACYTAHPLDFQ